MPADDRLSASKPFLEDRYCYESPEIALPNECSRRELKYNCADQMNVDWNVVHMAKLPSKYFHPLSSSIACLSSSKFQLICTLQKKTDQNTNIPIKTSVEKKS